MGEFQTADFKRTGRRKYKYRRWRCEAEHLPVAQRGRLRIKTGNDEFFKKAEKGRSSKNLGNTIHNILAGIKTVNDIEPACSRALAARMLLPGELETVHGQIRQMTDHPVAREWFTGKWSVLTETDVLTPCTTLRPDQIMVHGNEAVVVDFKSGMRKMDSHSRQVVQYAETLKETRFQKVQGYLWYIRENELIEV